jgi:hypothetical protein
VQRIVFALIGGALIAYGFSRRGATRPFNDNEDPTGEMRRAMMRAPDADARGQGTVAIGLGALCVALAFF